MPTPLPPGALAMGARFLPGVGAPALGVPLSELRNLRVDLNHLRRDLAARLPEHLPAPTAGRRVAAIAAELVLARPPDRLLARPVVCSPGRRRASRRFPASWH